MGMGNQQSVPANREDGVAFVEKAERLLVWASTWLDEFSNHGREARMGDVERVLYALLTALGTVHEALLDAAWHLVARDVRVELLEVRRTDPLLYFLWKARNDEVHGGLVKWEAAGPAPEIIVVDPSRVLAFGLLRDPIHPGRDVDFLFRYLYGVSNPAALKQRIETNPIPIPERLHAAGVRLRFALHAIKFRPFETREPNGQVVLVPAPTLHLGKSLMPIANVGLAMAISFYSQKVKALRVSSRPTRIRP